jgi:hypothetical protein
MEFTANIDSLAVSAPRVIDEIEIKKTNASLSSFTTLKSLTSPSGPVAML